MDNYVLRGLKFEKWTTMYCHFITEMSLNVMDKSQPTSQIHTNLASLPVNIDHSNQNNIM